jgi:uncharacterized protein (DUF58 family)
VLDLERAAQHGRGDESTTEVAIRVAASVAEKAIRENRAVGLTVNAHRLAQLQPDRGGRQHLKIMQLLAAVDGDGGTPFGESLVATVPRIRRGMTAVVITPSLDRSWVKPLTALRARGVGCVAITFDIAAFQRYALDEESRRRGVELPPPAEEEDALLKQRTRALRHALSEFDVAVHTVVPARQLGEVLVG